METKGGILSVAFLRRLPYIPPGRVTLSHFPVGGRGLGGGVSSGTCFLKHPG